MQSQAIISSPARQPDEDVLDIVGAFLRTRRIERRSFMIAAALAVLALGIGAHVMLDGLHIVPDATFAFRV